MKGLPESDVQAQCIEWLNFVPGLWVSRQNTGAMTVKNEKTGRTRHVKFGIPGQTDLTGCYRTTIAVFTIGVRVDIEVKAEGVKLTGRNEHEIEQLGYIDTAQRYGSIAFWCNSLDDCVRKLRAAFEAKGLPWKKSWEPQ